MRSRSIKRWAAGATWFALLCAQTLPTMADEPTRLGRLFRFGSTTDAKATSTSLVPSNSATPPGSSLGTSSGSSGRSVSDYYGQPALSTPPSTTSGPLGATPSPRITPKPRVNKPITESDPLVSRISVGRADGGSQFGMFMEVFADGTVIDGEGVHKVSPDALKPVVEAVSSGEFAKLKGHCGGPAGDTFENIHVVTYERAYGRLRANAFSYSGNPQGCDHAVHHLHKVLDELQMKMTAPGAPGSSTSSTTPSVVSPPSVAPMASPVPMAGSTMPMPTLPDPGLH